MALSTYGTIKKITRLSGERDVSLWLKNDIGSFSVEGTLPPGLMIEIGDRLEITPVLTRFERFTPDRIAIVGKAETVEITATISRVSYRSADGWIAVAIDAEGYRSASGICEGSGALERGMRCRLKGIPYSYKGKPSLELISVAILERDTHDPALLAARRVFPNFSARHETTLREALGDDWSIRLAANNKLIERKAFARWAENTKQRILKVASQLASMTMLRKDLLTIGLREQVIEEITALLARPDGNIENHRGMDAARLILTGHISFVQAEDLNRLANYFRASVDRRIAAIWGETANALKNNGSSAVPIADMRSRLEKQYGFIAKDIDATLEGLRGVEIVENQSGGSNTSALAVPHVAKCEKLLLERVKRMRGGLSGCNADNILSKFKGLQRDAIQMVIDNRICAVTGGPGTGKTTICEEIVRQLGDVLGIALAARAARNLKDKSGTTAITIHRFLRQFRATNVKRSYAALIIDEASMVGSDQLRRILEIAERNKFKRVVLIGDADQLPPIEYGKPFADLIAGRVLPVATLIENRRTDADGGISRLGSDMRAGRALAARYDAVSFCDVQGERKTAERIKNEYLGLIESGAKYSEIGVLTPYRDPKFLVSSECLNKEIRSCLGMPAEHAAVGEIVIAIRNDYDNNAVNGVRGIVRQVDNNYLVIQFDGMNEASYYEKKQLRENGLPDGIVFGYATSVHKAQGSEFKHVIVAVGEEMARVFGKPALYTAVTRARESLAIVGELSAIPNIAASPDRRTTVLGALLAKEIKPIKQENNSEKLTLFDITVRLASLKDMLENAVIEDGGEFEGTGL